MTETRIEASLQQRAARAAMSDWSWRAALFVALGGALGCVARYGCSVWLTRDYPWGTLFVNVLGSFAIGLFMFGAFAQGLVGEDARLFFVTGILGGFTTMSAFAFETIHFATDDRASTALVYAAVTILASLGAAYLGRAAALALPGAR